jgi:hypothetical protein
VTRRSSVVMLAKGGVASGKGKGGHNASWADMNLTGQKKRKFTWSIQLLQMNGEDLK